QRSQSPRNWTLLDLNPGDHAIGIHPANPVFMRLPEVLQGRLLITIRVASVEDRRIVVVGNGKDLANEAFSAGDALGHD
ncbi:hypothetical protein, partial [Ideonella dechloratans]|uniref:hypothetical protein n=1 Tax=Ideonella dechloratans TaxID=36863 RepID=UPI0035AEF255